MFMQVSHLTIYYILSILIPCIVQMLLLPAKLLT